MKIGELMFRLNNEKVMFNICRTMKQSADRRVVSEINYFKDHGVQLCCDIKLCVAWEATKGILIDVRSAHLTCHRYVPTSLAL